MDELKDLEKLKELEKRLDENMGELKELEKRLDDFDKLFEELVWKPLYHCY